MRSTSPLDLYSLVAFLFASSYFPATKRCIWWPEPTGCLCGTLGVVICTYSAGNRNGPSCEQWVVGDEGNAAIEDPAARSRVTPSPWDVTSPSSTLVASRKVLFERVFVASHKVLFMGDLCFWVEGRSLVIFPL